MRTKIKRKLVIFVAYMFGVFSGAAAVLILLDNPQWLFPDAKKPQKYVPSYRNK